MLSLHFKHIDHPILIINVLVGYNKMKYLISSILVITLACKNSLQNGIQDYPGPRHNDNETFVNWWNEFQTFVQEASADLGTIFL